MGETSTAQDDTMQDNVEGSTAAATDNNTVDFSDLFANINDDPNQEELDITTSESESDHESDLEEIEPPRPAKKGGRRLLPDAPHAVCASASNDEEDEFVQNGTYADYRYDGPTKGSATKKIWIRQDALQCLNVEFWLTRPGHQAGQEPDFDCPKAERNHVEYELFLRLEHLIHEYYNGTEDGELGDGMADGDTPMTNPVEKGKEAAGSKREKIKGESNLVRKTKNRVRDAAKAYINGGYGYSRGNKKWYTEFLPDRAELMLSRFVDPYGAANGTIAGHLQTMKAPG
ncbi:hypothetical protein LRP88_12981 [Fusarium phalaenopsidis]